MTHRVNNNTQHLVIRNTVDVVPLWRAANVTRVLRDERYTGKNIAGKTSKGKYGMKKTTFHPKSDWLVIPGTHEPVIPQETFDKVQAILGPYNQRIINKTNSHIFAGKIFCACCRHALRRYGGLQPKYVCRSSMELGKNCLSETIYESDVVDVVLAAIRIEIALAYTAKQQTDKRKKLLHGEREKLSGEIKKLSADVIRMKNSRESLFENYSDGKTTKEQYTAIKSELTNTIAKTETEIIRLSDEINRKEHITRQNDRYESLSPFDNAVELTPEMMVLVDGVYVYSNTRIEIKFAFSDERREA